jgi:hypothetical protein
MTSRERLTRAFLWLSVIGWGIGLGAKLFDLLVLQERGAQRRLPRLLSCLMAPGGRWTPEIFSSP